jgi:membrane-bound serine protease (ClpP class)
VVAFVAGGILLFDNGEPGAGVPLALIVGLAALSAAVVVLTVGMALRARQRVVVSGRELLLRATGEVRAVEGGEAWAEVMGERWKVRSAQPLLPGQQVRVLGLDGLTLEVRAEPQESSGGTAS